VLHQVIAEHLEAFLRAVAEAGDGAGLLAGIVGASVQGRMALGSRRSVWPSMSLTRAGSLDPRGGR